ncbi:hypothetical protein EUX98_g3516 [Antrodiella citrinella]|uniref:DUF6535 domain-containing protein n=1 Tax=Antrodiella citrinella TaxID=2447956 RepID=A0A4V6S1W0_9APHY|nr:hypothetical protein EUX98_g3516 [Antrodiella citrinella]
MSETPEVQTEAEMDRENEPTAVVLEVLQRMVRKAVADECAAKGPADSPQADPAPSKHNEAPRGTPECPNPPSAAKVVKEILTILKQSTIAGLFSAVSATFVTALQSNLAADPNATTQALLMMVFTGPDSTTIWVQSLLYASLGASLFAALAAMLGKEWVGHYARVGDSGSIEDRCIDRQSKLIAMRAWRFDMVLACIPLLLQGSLLLFGIALSAYMWSQQHAIAGVIVAVNVVGVLLYGVLLMCSLVFPDCPYHIPLTDLTVAARDRLLPSLLRLTSRISQVVSHLFLKRQSPPTLPTATPANPETAVVIKSDTGLQLDAPCVEWLLKTSTDPEALVAAARMALEVNLAQVKFDPTAVQQLEKMFRSCFISQESSSSGAHELLPSNYERAAAYGQALLGIYLDGHLMYSTTEPMLEPPDFGWLRRTLKLIQDHPDSRFICEVLSVLFLPKDMGDDDRFDLVPGPSDAPTLPQSTVIDWFSHRMLYFIYNIESEDDPRTWLQHYFVTLMLQWFRSGQLTARARANCSVACSMLAGCRVSLGSLAVNNKRHVQGCHYAHATVLNTTFSDIASFHAVASFQRVDIPSSRYKWSDWWNYKAYSQRLPHPLLLRLSAHLQLEYLPEFDLGHSIMDMRKILDFYSAVCTHYFDEESAISDYEEIFKGVGDISLPLSSLIRSVTSHITSRGSKFEGHITQRSQEWRSSLMFQELPRTWSPEDRLKTRLVQDNGDVVSSTIHDLNMDDAPGLLKAIELVWKILKAKPYVRDAELDKDDAELRLDKDDVERLEDQLVGFSFILSEVPDILTGTPRLDSSFYETLSFLASHTIPVLRYAALKIIRKLCGNTEAGVDLESLECLVKSMGGIDKFCVALSSCAPEMRVPDNGDNYIVWSTQAYLEVVAGLCGSWPKHFRHLYAPQLMVIADNLATASDGTVNWDLIRLDCWYAWKPLVQILFRCEEHEPGFIQHLLFTSSACEAEPKLLIACTPWHTRFHDSDAHPHSCIPVMVRYTVDTWHQQQLSRNDVLIVLRFHWHLKQRIAKGVSEDQSAAMLDAAREVWKELLPLFVQADLEEGTENKEGEMDIGEEDKEEGKGKGKDVDKEDEAQKKRDADEGQLKETRIENEAVHWEAFALKTIPVATRVSNDLETGSDV